MSTFISPFKDRKLIPACTVCVYRPFIKYCMKRVNMLCHNDITPIMVFDGGYLPTKAKTEKERRE